MKHTLAIITAALLGIAPLPAHAQGVLGVKGGVSYGNVSNRGVLPGPLDHRTGFAAGLALTPATGQMLGLGVEALYAQRGVHSSIAADSRELNYVDVPLYLRVAIPMPGVTPFAYAGPQMSFELSCSAGGADCPADRPKRSYAAALGGGVRVGPRGAVSVEGRYLYGLTDLKLSTVTSSTSYKTRSFMILAGLVF